jgi:hypothetical protein
MNSLKADRKNRSHNSAQRLSQISFYRCIRLLSNVVSSSLRRMIIISFFFLDIRVNASSNLKLEETKKPIQDPAGCILEAGSNPCSIGTRQGEKYIIDLRNGTLTVGSQSMAIVSTASRDGISDGHDVAWNLLSGEALLSSRNAEIEFKSVFGMSILAPNSRLILVRESAGLKLTVLEGRVDVKPRGASDWQSLATGLTALMSAVDTTGTASLSQPIPAPLEITLKSWARLTDMKAKDYAGSVQKFSMSWRKVSYEMSEMHSRLYRRKLAAVEQKASALAELALKKESEQKIMRDLFREKTLNSY